MSTPYVALMLSLATLFGLIGFPVGTLLFPVPTPTESAAAPNFPDVIRYKTGTGARAVVAVDVDLDQKLDLVTSNAGANSISVLTGIGNGTFRDQIRFPTNGKTPFALAVGRLNADDYPDVATISLVSSTVAVLLNTRRGAFAGSTSLPAGKGAVALDAADLNRDGFDDLIAVNMTTNSVEIFLNQAGKGFGAKITAATGAAAPRDLVIHDVNRDGLPDIVTANSLGSSVSLIGNRGSTAYVPAKTFRTAEGPHSVAAADFDGDGWPDLATAHPDLNTVSVLRNRGDGSFDQPKLYDARAPHDIRAADVNGDGMVDLVVSQPDRDSVALLLNQGHAAFGAAFELPVGGMHPTAVVSADLDRNGQTDLVTINEGSSDLSILLHGIAVPRIDTFTPGPTTRVSQTNGRLDQGITAAFNTSLDERSLTGTVLVYGSQSGFHDARVLYAPTGHVVTVEPEASTAFTPGETVTVLFTNRILSSVGIPMAQGVVHSFTVQPQKGSGEFVELERIKCDKIPGTLKAADFNDDGKIDIVALCREVDGIRVHLNRGNAEFDFDHHLFLPTGGFGPWDLVPADFNNDRLIDIAVVNTFSSNMAIFKNLGNGSFAKPQVLPCGAGPMGITAGDVNGDGFMDIAVAAKGFPEVLVFINERSRGLEFAKPVRYPVAPSPYSISARDLNNDGTLDLIMTNLESDRGTFLMNRGDGTFRLPEEFPLVLAKALTDDPIDVNADGTTDIVTVNTASDDISVLLNNGTNDFSMRKNIPVGLTPTDQVFGDFNSDGYVDVALTLDGGSVVIMMNTRNGGFEKSAVVGVGRNPTSPVSADFNGDGTMDLVIANQYSRDISVLVNLPARPTAQR